jgi:hypothetical protein
MSKTTTGQHPNDIFFDYYFLIKPVVKLLNRVLCQKESRGLAPAESSKVTPARVLGSQAERIKLAW